MLEDELKQIQDGTQYEGFKPAEEYQWRSMLSSSDAALVHIVRAFVHNPNILVINKPTIHFCAAVGAGVLGAMMDFVKYRGIEVDGHVNHRRPRLCFFSTDFPQLAEKAHVVWEVVDGKVIEVSDFRKSDLIQEQLAASSVILRQISQDGNEVDPLSPSRFLRGSTPLARNSQRINSFSGVSSSPPTSQDSLSPARRDKKDPNDCDKIGSVLMKSSNSITI